MKSHTFVAFLGLGILGLAGCGGKAPPTTFSPDESARAFAAAMDELAAAVEKNDTTAVAGAAEGLVNYPVDPASTSEDLKRAVQVYRTKVKGKLKGDIAAQVAGLMAPLDKAR